MKLPPGYTARPAAPGDLDEVAGLLDAWDLAYFDDRTNANRVELRYDWGAPWVDLERDTRVVRTGDGAVVAYVALEKPEPTDRFEAFAIVHPEREGLGIGSALLDWIETGAQRRGPASGASRLWNATGATNERGLELLDRAGFRHIRTFWNLVLDLDPTFEAGPAPPGTAVRRNVVGQDDRGGHAALEEAFASHFGSFPQSFEQWWERGEADETFDAGLGFVAEVDGQIVGASVNGVIDGVGWVYELGVRPAYQRRGIGRALLRHSLAMFAADGIHAARIGVDTQNATGALELYLSVGMRPVREWRLFEKPLGGG